jgi:hypothetical protein
MADFSWKNLLQQWNDRLLASSDTGELPADVRTSKWLGFPKATDAQIVTAEQRLGIPLPPSYRAFLKVSNGWRRLTQAIDCVWGTEEIRWFKQDHKDWIAAYTRPSGYGTRNEVPDDDYFSYETPMDFRPSHLKESLQISDVGDAAVFLLNPQVINRDGEWEAWLFANWLPGVHRYRSFQELIDVQFHQFFNMAFKQPVGLIGELPDEYIGAPGSPKRHIKKRRRRRAVKVLNKPLDQWDFDELLGLLNHEFWQVRTEAAWGLGKLKDPRAVEPLLLLIDDDSSASCSAMYALKDLAPERLREPLLDLLRKRHFFGCGSAAKLLAELHELRAVPIIVEMVKDTSSRSQHYCQIAAKFLPEFGTAGFDALAGLLTGNDPIVRARAAGSLIYTEDPGTIDLLRQLLTDADAGIRETAALSLKVMNAPLEPD